MTHGVGGPKWTTKVTDMIDAAIAQDEVRSLDLPHVIHIVDDLLGTPTVLGLFPDPITASIFAERYLDEVARGSDDKVGLHAAVIPLEMVWPAEET